MMRRSARSTRTDTLFPYTTLFRSDDAFRNGFLAVVHQAVHELAENDIAELRIGQNFPIRSRSEEHTSELQSLMRMSYAVFCLNKTSIRHMVTNSYIS